ncbi:MAG TPA: PKD domain-containing protein [Brumimicrobium sp.]|nr:PKD domain-containing protein [Brumimicrobium sp.]
MRKFLTIIFLFNVLCLTSQINPNDIQGLAHWYSADSLNKDINGLVDTIYDLSINNDHLIQNNSSQRPKFYDSAFNNKPIVSFNGSKSLETLFSQTITQSYTVFSIWRITGNGMSVFLDDRSNHMIDNQGGTTIRIFASGGFSYSKSSPFDFIITHAEFNGASSKIYENSVLKAQGSIGNSNLPGLTMGKRTIYNDRFFHGDFSQLLIYDEILSQNQIDSVYSYLQYYYAEPVNLGADIIYSVCDSVLNAGKNFKSYLWSDGSTADSLVVDRSGTYWVEVEDVFGFVSKDTIEVLTEKFEYPTQQVFCYGDSIIWNTHLSANYNFIWQDGSIADTLIINSSEEVHVKVTDSYGCVFQSDTLSFYRDDFEIIASLGPDTNLCEGNSLGLFPNNNTSNYLWSTGETTSEIEITNSGIYHVTADNTNGCEVKDTISITIIGVAPNVQIQVPNSVCPYIPFDFEDLSTTTDGSNIISWDWDFGEGSSASSATGDFAYPTDGNYDITLTIETSSGCFNTLTTPIEVKANPIMIFTSNQECQNQNIEFNGGQLSPQTITDWNWNFDDPLSGTDNTASGQNTIHLFDASGDFDVMLIGTDIFGCIDTLVQSKTIDPTPVADFTFTEVCEGNVVNYVNASTVNSPATISSYQWTFGDGTNSGQTNPQKPYAVQGNYTVDLTATANNGCSSTESKSIKIHAIPQVNFSMNQACAGIATEFTDQSFIPNGSVAQVDWAFNGGLPVTGFTVSNNFSSSGSYSLEQTVSSAFGCANSAVSTITIKDFIKASFKFSPNAFVTDYPIVFESTSTGANQYDWTFGNFATAQQPDTSIVFDESQIGNTYEVKLLIQNIHGCSDSASVKRTVIDRETDLEISQLFSQESNGYLTIGVRLKNVGSTPISKVDLFLRKPGTGTIKESWAGMLQAGEEDVYIFSASPSATVLADDKAQNYLCIEGRIISPAQFTESVLQNNEVCKVIAPTEMVVIRPYPNPVSDQLTIKVVMPKKEVIALHIYDDQGKKVHTITEKEELQKGLNTFYVNTSGWSAGNYKIRTIGESKVKSVGFVKL